MRRLGSLRNAEAFGPWLAAIARNRARDHWRRGEDTVELPEDAVPFHQIMPSLALVVSASKLVTPSLTVGSAAAAKATVFSLAWNPRASHSGVGPSLLRTATPRRPSRRSFFCVLHFPLDSFSEHV